MSGMPTAKNSIEMENHVFQKAKTKVCFKIINYKLIIKSNKYNMYKNFEE